MAPELLFILLLVAVLPMAWFGAEFGNNRALRISLGVAALTCSFGVAYVVGCLSRYNYNAWYGAASQNLIHAIVTQTDEGNADRVLKTLRRLDAQFRPTYENRANYDELINQAVAEMNGDLVIVPEVGRMERP